MPKVKNPITRRKVIVNKKGYEKMILDLEDLDRLKRRVKVPRRSIRNIDADIRYDVDKRKQARRMKEYRRGIRVRNLGEEYHFSRTYVRVRYLIENPEDVKDLAQFVRVINSKFPRIAKNRVAIIRYETAIGAPLYRSFRFTTMRDLLAQIIYTQNTFETITNIDETIGGSDFIDEPMEVKFSEFQIKYQLLPAGGRRSYKTVKSKYFKAKDFHSKDNNCLIACVTNVVPPETGRWGRHNEIRKKIGLRPNELIDTEQIDDVEDYFKININVYEDTITKKVKYYDNTKANIYEAKVDIKYTVLRRSVNRYLNSIDVLLKDSHYSMIVDRKTIKICPQTGDIVDKQYSKRKIKSRLIEQGRYKDEFNKDPRELFYLFFDYETVWDPIDGSLKPYSVSLYEINAEKVYKMSKRTLSQCKVYTKSTAREAIIRHIIKNSDKKKYIIIGYNSSNFDNFLLIQSAINNDCYISNILYVNNSILSARIKGHKLLDLCRFTMSPLKNACNDFKTNPKKIDGFSHREVQDYYLKNGTINNWIDENKEKLIEYNKMDVLSLASLFYKLRDAFKELAGANLENYLTISGMTYDLFKKQDLVKEKVKPIKDYELYKKLRGSLTAGRTEAFKGVFKYKGKLRMIDVKSLYPYVMLEREYPCGDIHETDTYRKDKLGMYWCKFKNRKDMPNIRPKREKDVPLDWTYKGKLVQMLTTPEIEQLRKYKNKVEVTGGYYWDDREKNLFNVIKKFKDEKTKQDVYRDAGNKNYNYVFRQICKLFMNSLSGKCIERVHETLIEYVCSSRQKNKFEKKIEGASEFIPFSKNKGMIKGIKKNKYNFKTAKPAWLGLYIYAYARCHMYDTVISTGKVIYMDTDSALLTKEDYKELKKNSPEMFGNEFGQYEEEIGEGYKCITISPKTYCVVSKSKGKSKYKCKGVRKTDKIIPLDRIDEFNNMTLEELHNEYYNLEDKALTWEFFDTLYKNKECYILTSQIRKSLVNLEKKIFNLKQIFMIKRISVKGNDINIEYK